MGAVDIAAVAGSMLRDDCEDTAFSLCAYNGLRLIPKIGVGSAEWTGQAIVYDPTDPASQQCDGIVLAACRAKLPSGTEWDVLQLADLLNARLCQAP